MTRKLLPAKIELGDGPGRGDAEDDVERHRDGGDDQRQPDGGQRIGLGQRLQRHAEAFVEVPPKTPRQRQHQEQRDEGNGERDKRPASSDGWSSVAPRDLVLIAVLAAQACKPLSASSMTKDTASITTPMAAAPA